MSLHIECSSDPVIGIGTSFDKITSEYDPPSFWFRIEASSSGQVHKDCVAEITGLWNEDGVWVNGFDPVKMLWLSEPISEIRKDKIKHYSPHLYPKKAELIGLAHVKLHSKYRDDSYPVPENNTPAELVPELKIDCSYQENKGASKRRFFPYGVYYIKVLLMDEIGESAEAIFKIWASPDPKHCRIRRSYFYERWNLSFKDSLGKGVTLGNGLPKKKLFNSGEYKENILNILDQKKS